MNAASHCIVTGRQGRSLPAVPGPVSATTIHSTLAPWLLPDTVTAWGLRWSGREARLQARNRQVGYAPSTARVPGTRQAAGSGERAHA